MSNEPSVFVGNSIPVDIENIIGLEFKKTKFNEGLRDSSYYAGLITGILNSGISEEYIPQILSVILISLEDSKYHG